MNRQTIKPIAALGLMLLAVAGSPAKAITLGFTPASQAVNAGSSFTVGVAISGLGDRSSPSLSTFDLTIGFDPGLLSFAGAAFGDPVLGGDQLDLSGLGGNPASFAATAPGMLNLFELSLDSAADLDALQAGSFTLAILTFNATRAGTGALGISINALGDSFGDSLAAGTSSGSIAVNGLSLPEPAVPPLLAIGLAGLACIKRKAR
jgi:hypothetical protein